MALAELELQAVKALNYALAHNGIPVINRLTVRNPSDEAVESTVSVSIVDSKEHAESALRTAAEPAARRCDHG